jgi:prepilin-type N-terminal cleavage/methylation domain-containing protein
MAKGSSPGFTLIETAIGMALVAIAVLGLAEMFTLSVMNNLRADRITTAAFLAQQRVDNLRNLTTAELTSFASAGNVDLNGDGSPDMSNDELRDINQDGHNDYRIIIEVQQNMMVWQIQVMVFTPEQFGTARAQLLASPAVYRVRANVSTIIGRQ